MGWIVRRVAPSGEMVRYVETGCCPLCGARIRDKRAPIGASLTIKTASKIRLLEDTLRTAAARLAPPGTNVYITPSGAMQCVFCHGEWNVFRPSDVASPASHTVEQRQDEEVDLTGAKLADVTEEGQFDILIATESISAGSEGSGAKTTRSVRVSRTVRRTVEIDFSRAKRRDREGSLALVGTSVAKRRIQEELTKKFSISTQDELTLEESVGVEVLPLSAVELIISWKLRCLRGTAWLTTDQGEAVAVPYELPLRLTFDHHTRDLPVPG